MTSVAPTPRPTRPWCLWPEMNSTEKASGNEGNEIAIGKFLYFIIVLCGEKDIQVFLQTTWLLVYPNTNELRCLWGCIIHIHILRPSVAASCALSYCTHWETMYTLRIWNIYRICRVLGFQNLIVDFAKYDVLWFHNNHNVCPYLVHIVPSSLIS